MRATYAPFKTGITGIRMESVGIMILSFPLATRRLQFFLEGKGICTFLLGHGKRREFLFEVDDMVVVPTIGTFHHDIVMHKVDVLVNDDGNRATTKEDARSRRCGGTNLLFFFPSVVGIEGEQRRGMVVENLCVFGEEKLRFERLVFFEDFLCGAPMDGFLELESHGTSECTYYEHD